MLHDAISGDTSSAPASRWSSVMVCEPPVVMLITALVARWMRGRNSRYTAGSNDGRPSFGSRACRCRMAAPASAAAIACSAICAGVIGRYSDMLGVWTEPVTAQVMMTLRAAMASGRFGNDNVLDRADAVDLDPHH